ncbi:maestro heat-like repeat-containing protein family member 6 [Oenanthe melanoleuca]|uniref:maestro heat-like repeat-containing protein family member 6 n=1 Tax=Oenanthe melanoleuca TaxID=2939378 RepID=UPI0024C130BB|nr:maestro heat-like repeat-containing protein family member 6 [Oenanthe melanoleuca]
MDRTQEQDPTRGRFRRTAQLVCKFIKRIREEGNSAMGTAVRAYPHIFKTNTSAALLDMLVEAGLPSPKQVPAMVRFIHQWLMANESDGHRLDRTLLDLTEALPTDVVMSLLRVAPSCDRAAMAMWKTILCSPRTAKPAQLRLLNVLGSSPEHSTCTSDGDTTRVLSLAATVVMWKILQEPCIPQIVTLYCTRLFVHLLFQAYFSTLDTPEEVDKFWKECQQQHGFDASPNRFAVQTLKSLLCRRQYEGVVTAVEHNHGWDMLLSSDTQHYAMGLLAREISRVSLPLCSRIICYLLQLLSTREPRWDLPALAFLVEILKYQDLSERTGKRLLQILELHLQNERRDRRCRALRALLELSDNPWMAEKMRSLTESLVELLRDTDGETVEMTIMLLSFIVLENDMLIATPITLQLAEALLPLFDHDNSQVQEVSILLYQTLVTLALEKRKKTLKTHVRQSLVPLFLHCHDKNPDVAEASREALHCVAKFMKRRNLMQLVKTAQLWKFAQCLLAEDRSRAAEHLRQALRYLRSPQEPLREAAVRFTGMAKRYLRGTKKELQVLSEALEDMADNTSRARGSRAVQSFHIPKAVERPRVSMFQRLRDHLHRAWRARPRLSGLGCLRCWRSPKRSAGAS